MLTNRFNPKDKSNVKFRFEHVLDRYSNNSKIVEEEYTRLELDFVMKSINMEECKFTNFVHSEQNKQYLLLKQLYADYNMGKNILFDFEVYDIDIHSKNIERLSKILAYNTFETFSNIRTSNVLKVQAKVNPDKLRLYIEKEVKNGEIVYVVKLIDLFHLAIPSKYHGKSADEMKEEVYNQHKNDKVSIRKIKQQFSLKHKRGER